MFEVSSLIRAKPWAAAKIPDESARTKSRTARQLLDHLSKNVTAQEITKTIEEQLQGSALAVFDMRPM